MDWDNLVSGIRQKYGEEETERERYYRSLLYNLKRSGVSQGSWRNALEESNTGAMKAISNRFSLDMRSLEDSRKVYEDQEAQRKAREEQAFWDNRQAEVLRNEDLSTWGKALEMGNYMQGQGYRPAPGAGWDMMDYMSKNPRVFGPGGLGYEWGQSMQGKLNKLPSYQDFNPFGKGGR